MNVSKVGSGDKILDWGVIIAALMLFAKTADVLSYFSPTILSDILGFNTNLLYGIVCALLVEGLALSIHFSRRATLSSTAQVVKWVLLGISGMCQVYDAQLVSGTVAKMSDTMKAGLSYGVPLIPLLITMMIFGIGQLPEVSGFQPNKPFIGLKPMWNRLINGGSLTSVPRFSPPTDLRIPPGDLKVPGVLSDNGSNPTHGEQK